MADPGATCCERVDNGAAEGRGRHGAMQAGTAMADHAASSGAGVVLQYCFQLAAMARPLFPLSHQSHIGAPPPAGKGVSLER